MTAPDLPLARAMAEDPKHHRRVAIKVGKPEVAAAVGSEPFLKKIETAAPPRCAHFPFRPKAV